MVANAPKWFEIHQNVSLGSNGVDRVRSLRKIPTRLRGTNCCTRSARFPPSFLGNQTVLDALKWYEMHQNVSLRPNGVDHVSSLQKILPQLRGTNFCTKSARFPPSFVRQPNGPKCTQWYETYQNISLVSNGVDRVRSLRKIPTRLRGTKFCTRSARFAPSFVRHPNGPECTQMVQSAPKRQLRVQWGGSGAFVAKNSDATLWHEHFYLFDPFCTEFLTATKLSRMHPNVTKCTKTSV
jgi:hypothetical protein